MKNRRKFEPSVVAAWAIILGLVVLFWSFVGWVVKAVWL